MINNSSEKSAEISMNYNKNWYGGKYIGAKEEKNMFGKSAENRIESFKACEELI